MENRETFLENRKQGIGGSDAAAMLGVSKWTSRQELWEDKVGLRPPIEDNAAMKRGRIMEPHIAEEYTEKTGRKLQRRNEMLIHPEHDFLIAHLDREILKDPRGVGVLEIKCSMFSAFRNYRHYGLPPEYIVQLQHYLMVSGRSWGSFAVFNADTWQLDSFDMDSDPDIHAKIIEEGAKFWQCVLDKTPPPQLENEELIKLPEVGNSDITVMDGEKWANAIRELREAKEAEEEAGKLVEYSKEQVQMLMGDNEVCEGAGCRVYWKPTKPRATLDGAALKKKYPEIHAEFLKEGNPSKSFKTYFSK